MNGNINDTSSGGKNRGGKGRPPKHGPVAASEAGAAMAGKKSSPAKFDNETLVCRLKERNQELNEQTEALRASEEQFRQLAESINEVCWIATASDHLELLYISPLYEKVFGRPCAQLKGNPMGFLDTIPAKDRWRVEAALAGLRQGENADMEHQIILPDGQMRWVHARASAIRDASGRVYRMAGIVEDITARKSTEDQLRQAQKMEVIGQLAGGVAHDFNNLLTIIGGNVELLLADSEHLSAEAKDYLNDIANAALRAETLTRQLLSFSRRGAMHMQVLNLNDLIAAFTKLLRRMLGESIVILNEFGKDLPAIAADPGMIEQILMNLAVNARDAMPSGGQLVIRTEARIVNTAEAQLRRRAGGVYVCLTVSDAGAGILPEHMARIFEPFFTTKRAGKGTGLGLTTVFGIVEQHKGWVEVSSQVGKGTAFRVFLPATTGKVADTNVTAQEETAGGGEKILVTEDDTALRRVMAEILQKRGYAIFEAESGVEAQQRWLGRRSEIDLLVTDIIMTGGVTGMELAEKLRLENPGLKVILISGYSAELPSSDVARKKNMIVLKKPFAPQELADTVRRCLDG